MDTAHFITDGPKTEIPLNLESIPDELKQLLQWVRWRIEPRAAGEKPTKIPYMPKANDSSAWGAFADAVRHIPQGDMLGIGFEFAPSGGMVGIDLDGCLNLETGEIAEWAIPILELFAETYAEVSPSGDDEETRKRITATLLAGEPIVLLDNIAGMLGCAALDALLTSTTWTDRI